MRNQKTVCCLYRTEHMLSADRQEMEHPRSACLQYAEERSWTVLREFWAREYHLDEPENMNDPLMELCAGAKGSLTFYFSRSLIGWDAYQGNVLLLLPFLSGMAWKFEKLLMVILEHMSESGDSRPLCPPYSRGLPWHSCWGVLSNLQNLMVPLLQRYSERGHTIPHRERRIRFMIEHNTIKLLRECDAGVKILTEYIRSFL